MLRNYLLIAWRNLLSNRLFSAINILGLAIGLACCILIALFVRHELSYDRHYENADRIVRVVRHFTTSNLHLATIAAPFGPLIAEDFPEVEAMTRINTLNLPLSVADRGFSNLVTGMADPGVFDFFNLEFTRGRPEGALDEPFTVVLTERAATQMFGNEDPMGREVTLLGQVDMKVTGVIRDLPENTHLNFDTLASISTLFAAQPGEDQNFGSNNYHTYFLLPEGHDLAAMQARFPAFLKKHLGEDADQWNELEIQRLTDIHLYSGLDAEQKANGNMNIVLTFTAIALVILTIACINFMNLTTARSTQRAKEVGMRKVAGATHRQLIAQFLGESVLLTSIAMLIAVALVELLLPWFSAFVERGLSFDYLANPRDLMTLLVGTLAVGVVAGSYPAFHLSAFRPAEVLKGAAVQGRGSVNVRKVLVVIQFAISITLMIATGVVLSQLRYTQHRDLGYERAHNLVVSLPFQVDGSTYQQYPPFRDALLQDPSIDSVTISSRVPTGQLLDGNGYRRMTMTDAGDDALIPLRDLRVGMNFFEHYAIDMAAGRTFDARFGDRLIALPPRIDETTPPAIGQAIINETAARRLGYAAAEDAVGEVLISASRGEFHLELEIVGVVQDFNFASLHDAMRPVLFTLTEASVFQVSIRSLPGQIQDAYARVEAVWAEQFPGQAQSISFLDERFDAMYRQERRQAQVFAIFAGLAIFVATLGLFGLASFTTERRTKEIGIRKVMGASVRDIVWLLTREFSVLVLIANAIAWPVAWYFMSDWLTRFAFRIDLGPLLFAAAALAAFLVAWVTVAAQASKAAMARPVGALRYE